MQERPGWKTSEFWLSVAAFAVSTLAASGAFGDGWVIKGLGVIGDVLAALGYQHSRTKVKQWRGQSETISTQWKQDADLISELREAFQEIRSMRGSGASVESPDSRARGGSEL